MTEPVKDVKSVMDEDNTPKSNSVVEMPWILISNQIQQLNTNMNERLNAINLRIDDFREEVRQRFEQVDKRFEQVDKRFEQVDKRFEQMDKRMDELKQEIDVAKKSMLTKPGYYAGIAGAVLMLVLGALLNQHIRLF